MSCPSASSTMVELQSNSEKAQQYCHMEKESHTSQQRPDAYETSAPHYQNDVTKNLILNDGNKWKLLIVGGCILLLVLGIALNIKSKRSSLLLSLFSSPSPTPTATPTATTTPDPQKAIDQALDTAYEQIVFFQGDNQSHLKILDNLNLLIQKYPNNARAHGVLSLGYSTYMDTYDAKFIEDQLNESAKKEYEKSLELDPTNFDGLNAKFIYMTMFGNENSARKVAVELDQLHHDNLTVKTIQARFLNVDRKFSESIALSDSVLVDPTATKVSKYLALRAQRYAYEHQKQYKNEADIYEKMVGLSNGAWDYMEYGDLLLDYVHDNTRAVEVLERGYKVDPTRPSIVHRLSDAYIRVGEEEYKSGNFDSAMNHFDHSMQIFPYRHNDGEIMATYFRKYYIKTHDKQYADRQQAYYKFPQFSY